MKAQFTFLSGARAGQIDVLGQSFISVGRHPSCDLKFDPEQDLDVSARHASVELSGKLYLLRDLGSTNGTFVNGRRLADDHVLASKDLVQFGPSGPKVEFTLIPDPPLRHSPAPAAAPSVPVIPGAGGATQLYPSNNPTARPMAPKPPRRTPQTAPVSTGGSTTRVRAEVRRQTRQLRLTTLLLFAALLLVTGAYFWQSAAGRRALEAQRHLLLGQVDSLVQQMASLQTTAQSMQDALHTAQSAAEQLRRQLSEGNQNPAEMATLRERLQAALRQQRSITAAATLDAAPIVAANQDAVGLVFVQFPSGATFTGTAFGVQTDASGGLVITNKHVVTDSAGNRAERIGVVFNGSNQNFKADLVALHESADLALLRVSVHRGIPVVRGLAAKPAETGQPVAVIGFPLGLDLPFGADWKTLGVSSTLTLGTVSRMLKELIQLDSYGAQGASGSPIFNRSGEVVGVMYGGEKGSNGRIVFGVPVASVKELIQGR